MRVKCLLNQGISTVKARARRTATKIGRYHSPWLTQAIPSGSVRKILLFDSFIRSKWPDKMVFPSLASLLAAFGAEEEKNFSCRFKCASWNIYASSCSALLLTSCCCLILAFHTARNIPPLRPGVLLESKKPSDSTHALAAFSCVNLNIFAINFNNLVRVHLAP